MFPGFVAKNIDAECGDECSWAAAYKEAAKAEERWQSGIWESWQGRQEAMT